jgi:hypothetical protein
MCNGQRPVKSLEKIIISMTSYFGYAQVYTYKPRQRNTSRRIFWAYDRLQKNPTIASGATPIGSADRAPDEKKKKEKDLKLFV